MLNLGSEKGTHFLYKMALSIVMSVVKGHFIMLTIAHEGCSIETCKPPGEDIFKLLLCVVVSELQSKYIENPNPKLFLWAVLKVPPLVRGTLYIMCKWNSPDVQFELFSMDPSYNAFMISFNKWLNKTKKMFSSS